MYFWFPRKSKPIYYHICAHMSPILRLDPIIRIWRSKSGFFVDIGFWASGDPVMTAGNVPNGAGRQNNIILDILKTFWARENIFLVESRSGQAPRVRCPTSGPKSRNREDLRIPTEPWCQFPWAGTVTDCIPKFPRGRVQHRNQKSTFLQ